MPVAFTWQATRDWRTWRALARAYITLTSRGAVSPPSCVRLARPAPTASTRRAPYGSAAVAMEARQASTICPGMPARGTREPTEPVVSDPETSGRGMSETGRLNTPVLPLAISDGAAGITRAATGAACAARGVAVPFVSTVAGEGVEAEVVEEALLLVLLPTPLRLPPLRPALPVL